MGTADASDLSDHRPRLSRSCSTLCLWLILTYKEPSIHRLVSPNSHLPCPAHLDHFSPFIRQTGTLLRGMVPAAGWSRELTIQHTSSLFS